MIAAGQVASLFQPIVQLSDGSVVAHEALSRGPAGSAMECPRLLFEAAGEESCEMELDSACRSFALRRAAEAGWSAGPNGPLFLNVRPGALAHAAFLVELLDALAAVGRGPRDVVLEVSEAERLDGDLNGLLAACRAAGFWIALDDAGAGRCGLQAIVEVVPDVVKVDRALVGGMDQHRGRRAAPGAGAAGPRSGDRAGGGGHRDPGGAACGPGPRRAPGPGISARVPLPGSARGPVEGHRRCRPDVHAYSRAPLRRHGLPARSPGAPPTPSDPPARRVTGIVTERPRRSTRTRPRPTERRSSIRAERAPTSARASGHGDDGSAVSRTPG